MFSLSFTQPRKSWVMWTKHRPNRLLQITIFLDIYGRTVVQIWPRLDSLLPSLESIVTEVGCDFDSYICADYLTFSRFYPEISWLCFLLSDDLNRCSNRQKNIRKQTCRAHGFLDLPLFALFLSALSIVGNCLTERSSTSEKRSAGCSGS